MEREWNTSQVKCLPQKRLHVSVLMFSKVRAYIKKLDLRSLNSGTSPYALGMRFIYSRILVVYIAAYIIYIH